jgi:hypothetical protein
MVLFKLGREDSNEKDIKGKYDGDEKEKEKKE